MDQRPVNKQTDQCDGTEMRQEVAIADTRDRADQHVLRIAGNGRHTANVGSRGQSQEIRQRAHTHSFADIEHQRRHEQANHIVHQERRQNSTGEDDSRKQLAGSEMENYAVGHPVEESCQMQAGYDQHHGEEQYQRAEVDALDGALRRKNAADKHQYRADDRHGRPIDLRSRQASEGEDEITGEEDGPRRNQLPMG